MPINIQQANHEVLRLNDELAKKFDEILKSDNNVEEMTLMVLVAGFTAMYERQGDAIILNLTTGGR
jgi:hypothetical protein